MKTADDYTIHYMSEKKDEKTPEPGIHKTEKKKDPNKKKKFTFSIWYIVIVILVLFIINQTFYSSRAEKNPTQLVDYSSFKEMVRGGEIDQVAFVGDQLVGYKTPEGAPTSNDGTMPSWVGTSDSTIYQTTKIDDPNLLPLLDEYNVSYFATTTDTNTGSSYSSWSIILMMLLPIVIFFIFFRIMSKRMNGEAGGGMNGVMQFNQNKSQVVAEGDTGIRFRDVAGEDESKAELVEIVDFLKHGEKYKSMGAKIPKGCLLVGPPGTGKTLLAKAVAGEAGVPFFKMSGADFVEMFVGVGAARVRDLFKQAREKSPCIIFIDEIDAIGRQRTGAGIGGNDEREQTLNQLLVEMDGFDARSGVIILAATNRPEILDPALLRPGRFDRQVVVDKPDLEGRLAILKIHTEKLKLGPDVDLRKIARSAAGFAGADLANIANEAALMAVREGHPSITQLDFENAIEKSVAGLEKKSRVLNPKERERVAFHETGHALTAYMTDGSNPVSKISIIPRGMGALGYTLQYPTEDRFLMSEDELLGNVDVMLGGRAAEEVVYGDISTGASNDIERASQLLREMITTYGMSEKYRNVCLPIDKNGMQGIPGAKQFSEKTQEYIDNEVARIMNERYSKVLNNLRKNRKALDDIAAYLLDKEIIEQETFEKMASERVIDNTATHPSIENI